MSSPTVRLGFADTPLGQLHYAEAGEGTPVILLHQTPRSWDEFREVLPLLGRTHRAIAMDMYGFGVSAKPEAGTPQTIEQYADGALALADALGIDRFVVMGHHTGSFVASEVAAKAPGRVLAAIMSAGEYADAHFRESSTKAMHGEVEQSAAGDVDVAPVQEDGSHLVVLWGKRYPLYPQGRPDILNRYIRDALAPGVDPAEGHLACGRYVMEDRVEHVTAPVLLLANTADPVSYPHTRTLAGAYTNAASVDVVEIEGGTVAVMEQKTTEVVAAAQEFLAKVGV
jgi:pimeloyl-ACP methyl ester carboxylesterase